MQTAEETLERGSGSCRDSAWLLVQILRRLGFAARFVSGYLIQLQPDEPPLEGAGRPRARLHRSARVGRGLSAGRGLGRPRSHLGHVRGRGAHPARRDSRSVLRRADQRRRRGLRGAVRVRDAGGARARRPARHQALRRTRPGRGSTRSASGSTRICAAATCGSRWAASRPSSRPTTWTAPSGRTPRSARPSAGSARRCSCRMVERLAPGGLLHFGQGKWYPGEPLPRWALSAGGGATACRSGAIRSCSPTARARARTRPRTRCASRASWRGGSTSIPTTSCRPTKIRGRALRAEGELPVNLDPSDRRIDEPEAARRACAARSSAASARRPAPSCRSSA